MALTRLRARLRGPHIRSRRIIPAMAAGALTVGGLLAATASPASAGVVPDQGTTPACGSPVVSGSTATVTCSYTGAAQYWTVPADVNEATFTLYGADGGGKNSEPAGLGAEVTATMPVTFGTTYQVNVGQTGPVNGGNTFGGGGGADGDSFAGGGASDIRSPADGYSLADRLLVAGGGGGAGEAGGPFGVSGGSGGNADNPGGNGQTITALGATLGGGGGGEAGTTSAPGAGGSGGTVTGTSTCTIDGTPVQPSSGDPGSAGGTGSSQGIGGTGDGGGGGGGGYYGGGAGGGKAGDACLNDAGDGGGGGGSSYTGGVSGATVTDGVAAAGQSGNGEVIISYQVLTITTTSLPAAQVGQAYSATLTGTGGTQPYAWSIAPSLPSGLSLNPATGVISGTPSTPSASPTTYVVTLTDANSQTASQEFQLIVNPAPLAVTTTSLPDGTVGSAYTQTLAATGGITPYTWAISNGSLPAGLTLDTSTGVISGTPATPGTAAFTVQATDSENPAMTATEPLSITVSPAPLAVTTTSLPGATVGGRYDQTLAASGGFAPYTWSVSSGSLPTGLSLSPSTGVISGTPAVLGTSTFTVTVTDAQTPAMTASQQLSITVGGCTTTITGKHTGALTVGSGVTCITGATITGAVSIPAGATVAISGSTLSGALSSSRAAALSICSTSIAGSVSVSGSTGFLLIGDNGNDGSPGCGADTIGGALALSGNTGGVQVGGTTVQGPASLTGNAGGTQVEANHIGGALACSGNTPPPSDNGQPNKVSGPASGQCSGLA